MSCSAVFTSRELPDIALSISVSQKNGQISPFSTDKLLISVFKSLTHRKHPVEDARGITSTIVETIYTTQKNGIINMGSLRDLASETLKRFDHASYVHYNAHHYK